MGRKKKTKKKTTKKKILTEEEEWEEREKLTKNYMKSFKQPKLKGKPKTIKNIGKFIESKRAGKK